MGNILVFDLSKGIIFRSGSLLLGEVNEKRWLNLIHSLHINPVRSCNTTIVVVTGFRRTWISVVITINSGLRGVASSAPRAVDYNTPISSLPFESDHDSKETSLIQFRHQP